MIRILAIILTGILTSFYFFPFIFKAFPVQNTKNLMAAVGLVILLVQLSRKQKVSWDRDFVTITIMAAIVSLIGFFSVAINETPDYEYATYIVSMWIWLSGAYVVTSMIRKVHGVCSWNIIGNYLIAVCVVQCVLAMVIDNNLAFKMFVDAQVEQGQSFLNQVKRLYGIGASLDVAGSRFAAVLVIISCILVRLKNTIYQNYLPLYIIAFIIIAVIGNMIARTTIVGVGVALAFLTWNYIRGEENKKLWIWLGVLILIAIPIMVYLYNYDAPTRKLIRFAFEGFFSLWEKGRWEVSSNERLMNVMVVFPDNLRTWIIGDGYFSSPRDTDPYFVGELVGGYYKGTDIGYLRFIFYFGVFGLLTYMAYFGKVTQVCIRRMFEYRVLFLMLLIVNFIVWFKVATDIFLVFALFLMIDSAEENAYNAEIALKDENSI